LEKQKIGKKEDLLEMVDLYQKDNTGDYDKVRLLKANINSERRRYWEAVLK
jgi:hypothetical protein